MKLDVTTRWNSTFEMLDSAIALRPAFSHYAEHDSAYIWLPSEDDWSRAESVRKFLSVFYNSTKKFSGCKYPTANIFLPELWKVKDALRKSSSGQDFLHFMIIVVLDPRYKMFMVCFICNRLYGVMGVAEAEKISSAASELYNLYACAAKEQSPHLRPMWGKETSIDEEFDEEESDKIEETVPAAAI
ncbi:zinc finger BED domain-containing protein RICESLEEPER 1-like [Magnolia sinica]|uniref:zinc finger BED domain-containing protein RICESLEEPER 1-like n=1 Tax=Magnolia sinica TaxID=86752 RepID=UPI002657B347|nr:zinc finger BED domain-containing protein RICESLEEPER 1-like [Magnolia sinica]